MHFAGLAKARGQLERAVRLWGVAETLRTDLGFKMLPREQAAYDMELNAVRAPLAKDAFAVAWAEGYAMTMEQAIDYARG
jgi:hypothetical protein